MIRPGQIWENGATAVKIQEGSNDRLMAVTFEKKFNGDVVFSHTHEYGAVEALDYLKKLNCVLTDKTLTVSAY